MFSLRRRLLSQSKVGKQPSREFLGMNREESAVVFGLIGSNLAVWGAWKYSKSHYKYGWAMQENLTVSRAMVAKKPHTLITAAFSHSNDYHLLGNMVTLFFFGPTCVSMLGARAFLSLYLGSGVVANMCHVVSTPDPRQPALGASGALNAIVTYSILMNPLRLIVVFADLLPLPMPAIVYGVVFIGRDAAALFDTELQLPFGLGRSFMNANIAHAAHLGGAACGFMYFLTTRGRGGRWPRLR